MNILSLAKKNCARFGFLAGCKVLLNRILQKTSSLRGVEFVFLHRDSLPTKIDLPQGFEARFLTIEEVVQFTKDSANDLDIEMADRLRGGKDFCFAALHENRLAAYGWYSLKDIEGEHNFGIGMKFPNHFAYMYKGFTHSDFRGQRLHGILMGQALQELHSHGIEALVSSVGWVNFASMASCDKLGYKRLGRVWTLQKGKKILSVPSTIREKNVVLGCEIESHLAPSSPQDSAKDE